MRPLRPTRTARVIAGAAITMVALAILVRPALGPETGPGPSATPPGDDAPEPVQGPWTGVVWQAVPEPFPAADPAPIRVDGLVAGNGLVVGWGQVAMPGRNQFNHMAGIFVSGDGIRWRSIALDDGVDALDASELRGVTIGPGGLLAYGGVCCTAEVHAMWASDDGVAWTRRALEGDLDPLSSFERVLGTPSGWVAVGRSGDQAAIWHSADGTSWEGVDPEAAGLGRGVVSDVALVNGTLIAVGTIDDAAGTHDGGVWMSDTGLDWRRSADGDPVLSGPDETELWRVLPFDDGIFVVGNHGLHEERVQCENLLDALASLDDQPPVTGLSCGWGREHHWLSPDGSSWRRLPPLDPLPGRPAAPGIRPLEFRLLAATGPGVVNLAEDTRPPEGDSGLWVSADGAVWRPVESLGAPGPGGGASGFGTIGGSLVAIGDSGQGGGWRPAFWIGRVIRG